MLLNKLIEREVSFRWFAKNLPEIGYKKNREILFMSMVQTMNSYNPEHFNKIKNQLKRG